MAIKAPNQHDPVVEQTEVVPETDAGPARAGAGSRADPQRRCIATHRSGSPDGMIRFVLSPDGVVTPDIAGRLPGRGAWVTADRQSLEIAVKKGAFSRAFKAQAKVDPGLVDQVEALLEARVLNLLGLGRRAGDIICGFEQVRDWCRTEQTACLIEASDSAEDGRNKLLNLLRARRHEAVETARAAGEAPAAPPDLVGGFTSEQLGMALGRERVVHACVKRGRFAQSWLAETARLSGFRRLWPEDWLSLNIEHGGEPGSGCGGAEGSGPGSGVSGRQGDRDGAQDEQEVTGSGS